MKVSHFTTGKNIACYIEIIRIRNEPKCIIIYHIRQIKS